jgi:hypothetical protein
MEMKTEIPVKLTKTAKNGIFNDLETLPLEKHARRFAQAFTPGG